MTLPMDLRGHVYGRLTVVERTANNKHGKVRWICRCQCGRRRRVSANDLRTGAVKSCGCLKRDVIRERHPPRVGRVFGRLTVISVDPKTGLAKTRCTCGGKHTALWKNMEAGRTKSCGCLRGLHSLKARAEDAGLPVGTVYSRRRKGLTIDEALYLPKNYDKRRRVGYFVSVGIEMVARSRGLTVGGIISRLRRGATLAEALVAPKRSWTHLRSLVEDSVKGAGVKERGLAVDGSRVLGLLGMSSALRLRMEAP
jgi:hypothetical protein